MGDLHFLKKILFFYLPRESASLKHFTKEPNGYKDSSLLRREWHFGGPQTSYSASLDVPLCSDVVLPPSRESFGVGASWQKISFGKKGAKRKNFIVSEHFLGHHFGLFHKMWVYLFWDWQISSWGQVVRLTHFDFFCNAANEIKLTLD